LAIPRKACSSHANFGGTNGCIGDVDHEGNATAHWKCNYCSFKLLSKQFGSAKARIHLSGDVSLRSGLITHVCEAVSTQVMSEMHDLIVLKKKSSAAKSNKTVHKREMIVAKHRTQASAKKQITLIDMVPNCTATDVDLKVGEMIFGLDITPFKAAHHLFKDAMYAVEPAPRLYNPPSRQKLASDVLNALFGKYQEVQRVYLTPKSYLGRMVTGDGATIMGTKPINVLCRD
jgi:hypothetical protein